MGSRLTDPATKKLAWNPLGMLPSEPGVFAANFERLFQVEAPLEPDKDNQFPQVADRVKVDPVNHFYSTISAHYGKLALSLHYDLRKTLAPRGLVPAVYCCGYDWRADNTLSATRLSAVVEEARNDCAGEQAILVAHSMGGIVSRYYCKQLGGETKVRALFLLGSPTLGSVSAYQYMREGLPFRDKIRRILNVSAEGSRLFMRRMQSIYQLLPNYTYCRDVRTSWVTFDRAHTGYRDKIIPGADMQNQALMFSDNSNSALLYMDLYAGLTGDLQTRSIVRQHIDRCHGFSSRLTVGGKIYMHPMTINYFCDDISTPGNMSLAYHGVSVQGEDVVVHSTLSEGPTVGGDQTVPADSANPALVSSPVHETRRFAGVGADPRKAKKYFPIGKRE